MGILDWAKEFKAGYEQRKKADKEEQLNVQEALLQAKEESLKQKENEILQREKNVLKREKKRSLVTWMSRLLFFGAVLMLIFDLAIREAADPASLARPQSSDIPTSADQSDAIPDLSYATGEIGGSSSSYSDSNYSDSSSVSGSSKSGSAKTVTKGDRTMHTGPRGGQYTITPSGNKNYHPRKN